MNDLKIILDTVIGGAVELLQSVNVPFFDISFFQLFAGIFVATLSVKLLTVLGGLIGTAYNSSVSAFSHRRQANLKSKGGKNARSND